MSQYVLSNLPGDIQDVLDWWVGPIGFMLPAEDQWTSSLMVSAGVAGASYVAFQLDKRSIIGGARVMTHWFTGTKYTRDIVRPGVARVASKMSIGRLIGLATMSIPTPLSLLFWTVTIAYSLPPSGRSQAEIDQRRFGWQTAGAVYNAQGQIVDYTM